MNSSKVAEVALPAEPEVLAAGAGNLRSRVLRAGSWVAAGHVASQALRLFSNLIMTRLLVPEMFGVMALAHALMVGLHLFTDVGLRQSVVHSHRGDEQPFLDTVWSVKIVRGSLVCLTALGLAGGFYLLGQNQWLPADSVYAEPVLPAIIAILSFNELISGFEPTKMIVANRRLVMGRLTLIDVGCQVAGILFMWGWAVIDRSIWVLVVGSLVTSSLRVIVANLALPGPANRWHWDRSAVDEIVRFGKWIVLSSILGFLAASGDRLMLGGLADARLLGLYSIACFMVGALRDAVHKFAGDVAFPALSEIARHHPQDLRATYYRLRRPIDIASLTMTGALLVAGHLIVDVLYDRRYAGAGHMLEILAVSLFEARYALALQCFLALGHSRLLAPASALQVFALYVLLPAAMLWRGPDAGLWVLGFSSFLALPLIFRFKRRLGLLDPAREALALIWLLPGMLLGWLALAVFRVMGWGA